MMLRLRTLGLVALLAVALVLTGFAHKQGKPGDAARAAYALQMGLEASDICGGQKGLGSDGCDACRLVSALHLPVPPGVLVALELGTHGMYRRPADSAVVAQAIGPVSKARGPPLG